MSASLLPEKQRRGQEARASCEKRGKAAASWQVEQTRLAAVYSGSAWALVGLWATLGPSRLLVGARQSPARKMRTTRTSTQCGRIGAISASGPVELALSPAKAPRVSVLAGCGPTWMQSDPHPSRQREPGRLVQIGSRSRHATETSRSRRHPWAEASASRSKHVPFLLSSPRKSLRCLAPVPAQDVIDPNRRGNFRAAPAIRAICLQARVGTSGLQ
jgi:hypothetical protein